MLSQSQNDPNNFKYSKIYPGTIQACTFEVAPCLNRKENILKNNGYKVNVYFYSDLEKKQCISKRKLLILPNANTELSNQPVFDVYSLNAVGTSDAKKLLNDKNIRENDLFECQSTAQLVKKLMEDNEDNMGKGQIMFVMDLKDFPCNSTDSLYANKKNCIKTGEEKFISFLKKGDIKASKNANKFREILSSIPLEFVFLEGGLKFDVLQTGFFSEDEKKFFQTKGMGSQGFCQFIEFFINGFKRGEKVFLTNGFAAQSEKKCFEGNGYIQNVSNQNLQYKPTHYNVTIYPSLYEEIADKGLYTTAMQSSNFFTIKTRKSNNITEMHTTSNDVVNKLNK